MFPDIMEPIGMIEDLLHGKYNYPGIRLDHIRYLGPIFIFGLSMEIAHQLFFLEYLL